MRESEFTRCIEAIESLVDGLSGLMLAYTDGTGSHRPWFGYLCGYCRALNEFAEQGPHADYGMVYQMFNDDDHENFHEGFVTALSLTMKAYNRAVDESNVRFISVNPQY